MRVVERTLGDICDQGGGVIQTGPFGSQLHEADYAKTGTPVVMPKDIIDSRVSAATIARVESEHVERLAKHQLSVGDIVYGRRGDIGRQALITEREAGWLCGTGCLRVSVGQGSVDAAYLHYYLRQPTVIEYIGKQAVGSTMANLNTGILRSIPIRYPAEKAIQLRIVAVLSSYDDLIANNSRRMATLEEMARQIYEEWFIHFRFLGHELVARIKTELGWVPQGWPVMSASEALEVNPKVKVPKEGVKPFAPMGSLATDSMLISNVEWREGNSGAKFQNGDTLFARITPCLENGKTGFVQFLPAAESVAFGSTEFIVLRSKNLCPEYVYLLARSESFRNNAIKSMGGADGRQRVREGCFDSYKQAYPDQGTIKKFAEMVRPMFHLIQLLADKNINLHATRDLLLPRLISGEVDVSALLLPQLSAVSQDLQS